MPTRFYLPLGTAAPASPGFESGWDATSQAVRRGMTTSKGTSPITEGTTITLLGTGNYRSLDRQYVSKPLTAQTISGTVTGQLLVREFSGTDNVDSIHAGLKVVSGDGSVVRGTLLALGDYAGRNEFLSTGFRNKKIFKADSVTSVVALAGDRIVLEIGYRVKSGGGTTPQAAAKWGENAADLPVNESQVTNGAGWIEFSGTISVGADHVETMAGGVVVSPASSATRETFATGSGGAVLSTGSDGATVATTYGVTASGGPVVGGSMGGGIDFLVTGSGGIIVNGSAPGAGPFLETMAGGVALGGTWTVTVAYGITGSGGAVLGGTAPTPTDQSVTMAGGVVLAAAMGVSYLPALYMSVTTALAMATSPVPTWDPEGKTAVALASTVRADWVYMGVDSRMDFSAKASLVDLGLAMGRYRE